MIKRDRKALIKYAPLQGKTALQLLPEKYRKDLESVVYISKGKVLTESNAALAVLIDIGMPWSFVKLLFIFPKSMRDIVYRLIARKRYRWFGKREACRIPNEKEARSFLD